MIRILNFACVALMGLTILALYHVSEQTRVTSVELRRVERGIRDEEQRASVLQAQWEQVANPERIQHFAQASGMDDTTTAQLASLTQLPFKGGDNSLGVRAASAQMPVPAPSPIIKISAGSAE